MKTELGTQLFFKPKENKMKLNKSEMHALARKIRSQAISESFKQSKEQKDSEEVKSIVKRDFEILESLSPQMKDYIELKRLDEESVREMVARAKFGPEKEVLNIDNLIDIIILKSRDVSTIDELLKSINPFEDDE